MPAAVIRPPLFHGAQLKSPKEYDSGKIEVRFQPDFVHRNFVIVLTQTNMSALNHATRFPTILHRRNTAPNTAEASAKSVSISVLQPVLSSNVDVGTALKVTQK